MAVVASEELPEVVKNQLWRIKDSQVPEIYSYVWLPQPGSPKLLDLFTADKLKALLKYRSTNSEDSRCNFQHMFWPAIMIQYVIPSVNESYNKQELGKLRDIMQSMIDMPIFIRSYRTILHQYWKDHPVSPNNILTFLMAADVRMSDITKVIIFFGCFVEFPLGSEQKIHRLSQPFPAVPAEASSTTRSLSRKRLRISTSVNDKPIRRPSKIARTIGNDSSLLNQGANIANEASVSQKAPRNLIPSQEEKDSLDELSEEELVEVAGKFPREWIRDHISAQQEESKNDKESSQESFMIKIRLIQAKGSPKEQPNIPQKYPRERIVNGENDEENKSEEQEEELFNVGGKCPRKWTLEYAHQPEESDLNAQKAPRLEFILQASEISNSEEEEALEVTGKNPRKWNHSQIVDDSEEAWTLSEGSDEEALVEVGGKYSRKGIPDYMLSIKQENVDDDSILAQKAPRPEFVSRSETEAESIDDGDEQFGGKYPRQWIIDSVRQKEEIEETKRKTDSDILPQKVPRWKTQSIMEYEFSHVHSDEPISFYSVPIDDGQLFEPLEFAPTDLDDNFWPTYP